jgi:proliferating cell nuclear antigen
MMKTMQMNAIKTVFGAMKDILIESAMVIRPNGISITNMDKTHCIYVNMFLEGDKFQEYFCNAEKIAVGINLIHLFRVISTMSVDDTLTLYILKSHYEDGIVSRIGIKLENASIRKSNNLTMLTQDIELDDMDMPHARFSSVITMPSADFQKIIKDMKPLISDRMVIRSVDDQLLFIGKGNIFDAQVTRAECEDTMGFIVKPKEGTIIQGVFSVTHLLLFTKCTSLCSQIELYFENDLPLIVNYKVSTLGSIGLCATPLDQDSSDPL